MNAGEIQRMIANLIKEGVVAESNPAGFVRVQHGDLTTDWLPYFVPAAGGVSVHRTPSIGERCIVLSPSGETANAFAFCGFASEQHPAPSASADETVMRFPDGAQAKYNHASGALALSGVKTVTVQAGTSVTIDCPNNTVTGTLTVQGLLTYQSGMSGSGGGAGTVIEGNFVHNGNLTNTGTISSNGVKLDGHTHPDTTSGGNTGVPNK